jgi:hypothetical protein
MSFGRSSVWLFLVCAEMLGCGSSSSGTQGSLADSGGSDASGQGSGDSGIAVGDSATNTSGDSGVVDAAGFVDATSPVDSGSSLDGAGPVDAASPVDAVSPADATNPVDASPADAAKPADAANPVDAASPADASKPPADACTTGTPLAFPGAIGFGSTATGGRGYAAYHVTNLNDTGAGSFRDAVSAGHRIIVFDVGGIINLASAVSVSGNLTIAGQTAPGGGIALEGAEVSFSNSSNDIVRNLRIRQGTNDPDTGKSGIAADTSTMLIFDHMSIEFGQWDNLDINSGMNVTMQRSIIGDPIGQQFNAHCDSTNLSWFENIFSSAHNRSPLAKGDTQFVNNVVYNFQAGYTAGNTGGLFTHDIVNNYFITGPSTTNAGDAFFQVNNQAMYFEGNVLDSNHDGTLNGSAMGLPGGATALTAPWDPSTTALATASAAAGYAYDIVHSGALPHDDVDALVLADVTSLGTKGQLWTSQSATNLSNGGYGTLAGGTAPTDTDGDGIPDAWETANGLNPNNAADAIAQYGCTGYTNLEEYVNQLADSLM